MRILRDGLVGRRWQRIVMFGALALAVLGAGTVLAQPANDNFANATDLDPFLASGTHTNDNNVGATREPGEPLIVTNVGGASVWYTWTAPSNAVVTFSTAGSDFDTLLGVFIGRNLTNLLTVAQDDSSGPGGTSAVTFNAPAGTRFYLAVDGSNGVTGDIVLNWMLAAPAAAPANDNFANATPIGGDS